MNLQEKLAAVQKKLDQEFPGYSDAINGMTLTELRDSVLSMSKNVEEIKLAKEGDKALKDASALAKELAAPYNEAARKSAQKLQFMNLLLKSKTDVE